MVRSFTSVESSSVVTMTVGNIAALTQSNIKRMLAYSSIAHAGYLLIGVVAGTSRGVAAMLIYLLIYAFMQMGAFAVVVLMRRADAIGDELKDLSGLYARQPFAAVAMLIFMLSLGGIPPTAGFMGKFWLFSAAIDAKPGKPGQLTVNTQRTQHEIVGEGERLTLLVDPTSWIDRMNVDALFALDVDGDGSVAIPPDSTLYESILQGMLNRTPVGFRWE